MTPKDKLVLKESAERLFANNLRIETLTRWLLNGEEDVIARGMLHELFFLTDQNRSESHTVLAYLRDRKPRP